MRKLKEMLGVDFYEKLRRQKYYDVNRETIKVKARLYVKKRLDENPNIRLHRNNNTKKWYNKKRALRPLKVKKEKPIYIKKERTLLTKEEKDIRAKAYYLKNFYKNKEKIRLYRKEYQSRPEVKARKKERQRNLSSDQKEKRISYIKNRKLTDPLFKLKGTLRKSTADSFKKHRWKKCGSTEKLLGVPYEIAKQHIEGLFKKGMSWDNHGINGWHIDHKIPLASAKTEEDLRALCYYKNLQPMWAIDNIKKSDKILPIQTTLTI